MAKLKPTHQLTASPHSDVTAWQFNTKDPLPVWVASRFHPLSGYSWKGLSLSHVPIIAKEGDWAVRDVEDGVVCVLHDNEFEKLFVPIPPK